ncbi:MAG: hypothetical protein M3520_11965 [Actinomycetota bacterium]|nr:hypothetical protein [Actinomycetota bacterium]
MADIQIRSVDEQLARDAKARAAETHRTLSDYVKALIEQDLRAARSRERMQRLLQEIDAGPHARVDRRQTAAALSDIRREMGTA